MGSDVEQPRVNDHTLFFSGFLLATLGMGMHLLLTITAIVLLIMRPRRSIGRRLSLPFSIIMLTMSTTTWSIDAWFTETLLLKPNRPSTECGHLVSVVAGVFHTMPLLLSDALLLFRAYLIVRGNPRLMVLPCIMYGVVCGLALAIMSSCQARSSIGSILVFPKGVASLPIAFFTLTISLNVYLTSLIVGTLLAARRALKSLDRHNSVNIDEVRPYTTIIGIFAESAAAYTTAGIVYVGSMARPSGVQYITGRLFFVAAFLAPAVIVIRISLGVAYSPETIPSVQSHPAAASPLFSTAVTLSVSPPVSMPPVMFHHSNRRPLPPVPYPYHLSSISGDLNDAGTAAAHENISLYGESIISTNQPPTRSDLAPADDKNRTL